MGRLLAPDIAMPCAFLIPCGTSHERLDVCSAQLLSPSMPWFSLTLPPSDKSSIKARGHHPSHLWGGPDCRFQTCPSHKGLKWDLFRKAHNPLSLGSSSQKSELSADGTEGVKLYRPWVTSAFQPIFPLDHRAGGDIEKLMCLK